MVCAGGDSRQILVLVCGRVFCCLVVTQVRLQKFCFVHILDALYRSACVFCRAPSIFFDMIQGKLWSVRVYWGATRLLCWSLDSNKVCLQSRLDIPSAGVWKNCCLCGWGFETNPGLRSCFLLPGGDTGVSPKVLFCSHFGCPVVYFAGCLRYSST